MRLIDLVKYLSCVVLIFGLNTLLVNCKEDEQNSDPTIVQLDGKGKLQGLTLTSRKGRKYFGFLGVPYGKIPQRFAVSQLADEWTGVKKVQKHAPPCFHFCSFTQKILGVEECLTLNLYTPTTKRGSKLPVMVWLFPGGFQLGDANMVEAKYMLDEDVVFVSINYRLGAMGFLNLGNEVSGNMGLKDQTLALQWVKQFIHHFGGDPNLVTLWGLSAGGAAVQYHLLSPMSKGLVHRAISLSGSALNPWAYQPKPKEIANKLIESADCKKDTDQETLKCLREKEPSGILNAQLKLKKYGIEFDFITMKFVPSIESPEGKGPKFLTDSPYNLLKRGEIANKVPYISGFAENEGSFYNAFLMPNPKALSQLNSEWNKIAPNMLYYEDVISPTKVDTVSKKLLDFYFEGKEIGEETRRNMSDIFSDRLFSNGIAKGIQLLAPHQPVYSYITQYLGSYSLIQSLGMKEPFGVGHGDELIYLFNRSVGAPEVELDTDDGEFSEQYIKMMVSFAKTGKPTEERLGKKWTVVKVESKDDPEKSPLKYLEIDLEPQMVDDPLKNRRDFWSALSLKEHQNDNLSDSKDEL